MKKVIIVLAGLLILSGIAAAQNKPKPAPTVQKVEKAEVKPPLDPPAEWVESLNNFLSLTKQIDKIEQETGVVELQNMRNKLANELNAKIPAGYYWDATSKKFQPIPAGAAVNKPEDKK